MKQIANSQLRKDNCLIATLKFGTSFSLQSFAYTKILFETNSSFGKLTNEICFPSDLKNSLHVHQFDKRSVLKPKLVQSNVMKFLESLVLLTS